MNAKEQLLICFLEEELDFLGKQDLQNHTEYARAFVSCIELLEYLPMKEMFAKESRPTV